MKVQRNGQEVIQSCGNDVVKIQERVVRGGAIARQNIHSKNVGIVFLEDSDGSFYDLTVAIRGKLEEIE